MKIRFSLPLLSLLMLSVFGLNSAQAATITVTERADSFGAGLCSLRDAVEMVNTNGMALGTGCSFTGSFADENIIFLEGGAPYIVSLAPAVGGNADGDIDITADVLIQGQGTEETIVMGQFPDGNEDRIFDTSSQSITLSQLTVTNGITSNGGGIANSSNLLTLDRCRITGNQAFGNGGGLFNSRGIMALNETTVDDNEAGGSGGGIIHEGFGLFIYNSTISDNRALGTGSGSDVSGAGFEGVGGGIAIVFPFESISMMTNSTISTNTTANMGGGIYVCDFCGGDSGAGDLGAAGFNFPPGVYLFNDTIVSNTVTSPNGLGGGIFFNPLVPPSSVGDVGATGFPLPGEFSVGLFNTILSQNTAVTGPDCFDTIESGGFNLYGTLAGCDNATTVISDQTDPALGWGPLQNNGGPTETHGLLAGSIAIDNGNDVNGCQAPVLDEILVNNDFTFVTLTRDQRNFPRPIAVNDPSTPICDVGAFEFQVFDFTITKDDGLNGAEIPTGTVFDYTIMVTNNGPGTATAVTLNDSIPVEMDFVSVTSSQGSCAAIGQVLDCDLGDLAVGETATITVTVTATEAGSFTNVVTVTLNNEFQEQLTETAQVTTVVTGGLLVEGSGIHCELQPGVTQASPGFTLVSGLMAIAIFSLAYTLRRKAHG